MTRTDTHGLPVSTSSDRAARLYRDGMNLLLSAWPGAGEAFEAAIAEDADFALAHAALARVWAMRSRPTQVQDHMARALALAPATADARQISHVEILALALGGRSKAALPRALEHAEQWPRDVAILSLPLGAFGLFAFSGMTDHNQAKADLCERHAGAFDDQDWWFLTYHGWSLAENGEVARGRALLERAIDLRRANANAAHALAHALFEAGENAPAAALIADWIPGYDRSGILHGHLTWHAAVLALERGDPETALQLYADGVRPAASQGMPINIVTDSAALLWRAQIYGHAVPAGLWREAADYAAETFPNAGHSFIDPHMMLLAAAVGDDAALQRRLNALDRLVADDALAAGSVVPVIGRAAGALAAGDAAGCARILTPMMTEVVRLGGSNAQREIIEDTLIVALIRAQRLDEARAALEARLSRRPSPRDSAWLNAAIS